jgi:hypothetical protein
MPDVFEERKVEASRWSKLNLPSISMLVLFYYRELMWSNGKIPDFEQNERGRPGSCSTLERDNCSFKSAFVKANLSASRDLAMSLIGRLREQEIRSVAESFGAVRTLDKAKLCDELIPAILQMEN